MAKTLREIRLEKGLTVTEVARYLGIGHTGPSAWERGIHGPSPRHIPRLAVLLQTSAEEVRIAIDESRRRRSLAD